MCLTEESDWIHFFSQYTMIWELSSHAFRLQHTYIYMEASHGVTKGSVLPDTLPLELTGLTL